MVNTGSSIQQQQQMVSSLTTPQLTMELQQPSSGVPQYLLMGELQKRQQMQTAGVGDVGNPIPSVRQQMIQQAQAAMSNGRAPLPTSLGGMPGAPAQMAPPAQAPQMAPPSAQGPNMGNGLQGLATMGQTQNPPNQAMQAYARGGMVQRFDDGGDVDIPAMPGMSMIAAPSDGGGSMPAQAPVQIPAFTGYLGMPTAQQAVDYTNAVTNNYLANSNILKPLGMDANLSKVQGMISDPSSAYDNPIATLAAQAAKAQSQSKGQALLQAGLAMMSAPGTNLLSGIAAGGQAGLASYQQTQANQRALQMQLANAQVAQANAHSQAQQSAVQTAASMTQQQNSSWESAQQRGMQLAEAGLNPSQIAAKLQQENFDAQTAAKSAIQSAGIHAQAEKDVANITQKGENDRLALTQPDKATASFNRAAGSMMDKFIPMVGTKMIPIANPVPGGPLQRLYTTEDAVNDAAKAASILVKQNGQGGAQAPAPVVAPMDPAKRSFGTSYQTPKGIATWTKQGWLLPGSQ